MIERCYKLHRYPPGHKFSAKGQPIEAFANQSSFFYACDSEVNDQRVGLTKAQYQQLMILLQPQESFVVASPSANQIQSTLHSSISSNMSGIPLCLSTCTHNLLKPSNIPWIIDTGATNHMVCSTYCFTNIKASVSYSVKLVNGHNVQVTHIGTI